MSILLIKGKFGVFNMAKYFRFSTFRALLWAGLFVLGALGFIWNAVGLQDSSGRREAVVLSLNGPVTPPVADYLSREIDNASDQGAEVIVIEMDTPGGLISSMEVIIKAVLGSKSPVVTYVTPSGAKSASAGLYIMYSAHISAMTPATNTGSATPITLGGGTPAPVDRDLDKDDSQSPTNIDAERIRDAINQELSGEEEVKQDAENGAARRSRPLSNEEAQRAKFENNEIARIRALAHLRGRNAEWAVKAITEAANIPANEALEMNVIDLIATNLDDLLDTINGQTVTVNEQEKTINTDGIIIKRVTPTLVENILGLFANPNVAAILMSLGTLGLTVELWNPGSIFPGFFGIICLGLGLYSVQVLPFNWLGVLLIIVGVLGIILEAYTPTFGLIGLVGLLCFAAGLYLLFPVGFQVSTSVILTMVAIMGGLLALVLYALVGSRSHGPMIGEDAIRHREGVVDEWDDLEGHVLVEGERWRARSNGPLQPGDRIKVIKVEGLVLIVRKMKSESANFISTIENKIRAN